MKEPALSWYHRCAAQGKCRCGRELASGRKRCTRCLRKANKDAKKRYKRYADDGRCRRCTAPPLPGRIHCAAHHKKAREEGKKAITRFITKRRDAEQCVTCGEPSKTYNCKKCREKIAKRARKKKHP